MERGQHEFLYTKYNTSRDKKESRTILPKSKKKLIPLNRKERKEIDYCSIVLFFTSPVRYIFYLENEFANELI